jgi:hypothetical protein
MPLDQMLWHHSKKDSFFNNMKCQLLGSFDFDVFLLQCQTTFFLKKARVFFFFF